MEGRSEPKPFFNALKGTRNCKSLCVLLMCWLNAQTRWQQLHPLLASYPPSVSQTPGPGEWHSVAHGVAALLVLGVRKDRHSFQFVLWILACLCSSPPLSQLSFLMQSRLTQAYEQGQGYNLVVMSLCRGRMDPHTS